MTQPDHANLVLFAREEFHHPPETCLRATEPGAISKYNDPHFGGFIPLGIPTIPVTRARCSRSSTRSQIATSRTTPPPADAPINLIRSVEERATTAKRVLTA